MKNRLDSFLGAVMLQCTILIRKGPDFSFCIFRNPHNQRTKSLVCEEEPRRQCPLHQENDPYRSIQSPCRRHLMIVCQLHGLPLIAKLCLPSKYIFTYICMVYAYSRFGFFFGYSIIWMASKASANTHSFFFFLVSLFVQSHHKKEIQITMNKTRVGGVYYVLYSAGSMYIHTYIYI